MRANVEASVKEVKRGVKNGKVRIRGYRRIKFYLCMTSIAVNLTRIHKYLLYCKIDTSGLPGRWVARVEKLKKLIIETTPAALLTQKLCV